ncbi:MAG: TetR/AcrR family transcriptional regulator [Pseudomonadota bacterium]
MPKRKAERKRLFNQMIRTDIQEAVINLVTRTGIRRVTMDQVATEAGVSKGCLYLHFHSKKELLESVKEACFEPLVDQLQVVLDGPLPPDQKIESFVRRMFGYFDENQGLFRFLLEEREIAQSQVVRQKDSRYRNFVERIAGVLNDGIVAGFFRNLEYRKVASMLLEAMIAMTARRLMDEDPRPVEEDAQLLIEVFIRGVALRPGPH